MRLPMKPAVAVVEGKKGYTEYVICSGHGGYGWTTGGKVGSVSKTDVSYTGEKLRSYVSGNYMYIATVSTLEGEVEVEYWTSQYNNTPTLQKGKFTAGQTITNILYATSRVHCFAGVVE